MTLEQIVEVCGAKGVVFSIVSAWPAKDEDPITYEWRVDSCKRFESNAAAGYLSIDKCLEDCLAHVRKVVTER